MFAGLLGPFHNLGFVWVQARSTRLFSSNGKNAWNMERYHSDPVYRRQQLDLSTERQRLYKARNPEFHEKQKTYYKEAIKQKRSRDGYIRFERLTDWVRRSGWHRADLSWKSYRPELSVERVIHPCSGCKRPDYRAKLWWSSIDSEKYLCGMCWSKLSWEEMCPEGFEDTATMKEFSTRAKELGIEKPLEPRP